MKDLVLALVAVVLLASVYRYGQVNPHRERSEAARPSLPAPVEVGAGTVISLYNPDGRLLKFFEVKGPIEWGEARELVFSTQDGKRVRTNASYILESTPAGPTTTR